MVDEKEISNILIEVEKAYRNARCKFGPFVSKHEGYAIIKEELDELWDDIKADNDNKHLRAEALHVASMAVSFIFDICDKRT